MLALMPKFGRSVAVISRRTLLTGTLLAAPALLSIRTDASELTAIDDLERRYGGRLGVAVRDTATGTLVAHRGYQRFPLCSTFKFLAAAFVLARVDRNQENLTRRITYSKNQLVPYSPVTEKHVEGGLSVGEICEAAMTLSDNTAGNLLLDSFGGPSGLTAFMRSLGDNITRLDRREPDLNEAKQNDLRDTTTPVAMLEALNKLVLGTALSTSSRKQLIAWLIACRTGDKRLRSGVPADWSVGDKTGSGNNNATNDIAVLWPPNRAPILVTAYYVDAHASDDDRNAVLAEVGRIAVGAG